MDLSSPMNSSWKLMRVAGEAVYLKLLVFYEQSLAARVWPRKMY